MFFSIFLMDLRNYPTFMKNTKTSLSLNSGLDYEFLDAGNYRKLERFGKLVLDRPEIQANWNAQLSKTYWQKADWYFQEEKGKTGVWKNQTSAPEEWEISYDHNFVSLSFHLRLTAFKHIGVFPEQAENWNFIQEQLSRIKEEKKVLNLFAYTGAASVVAAANGALVTNVDSVKQVLNWGRDNATANGQETIRWILEDARKFVEKSLRRGDKYHGIIMDPPAFGYGSKKEKWRLEKDLKSLLEQSVQLLNPEKNFFILNTYSPKLPLQNLIDLLNETKNFPKQFDASTLGLMSQKGQELELGSLIRFSH
jgi:23S rRNA (cytosine1962-C5)-methyltransferase